MKLIGWVDDMIINVLQYVYDFFLDGFGIRVGSFRGAILLLLACFSEADVLHLVLSANSSWTLSLLPELAIYLFFNMLLMLAGISWVGRFKFIDQKNDNRDQAAGRLLLVNSRALRDRSNTMNRRIAFAMMVCLWLVFGPPPLNFAAAVVATWLGTIMVRERDGDRFTFKAFGPSRLGV